jgi:hypothetical protein
MNPLNRIFRQLAAAVAMATAGWSAQASPLIAFEDFETVGPRDVSLALLNTAVGTFTPAPGFNVFIASPGYTNFGPGINPTTSSVLTASGDENFGWTFAFTAAMVQLEVYLNDLGPATLSFYDAADVLLQTFNFDADGDGTNNIANVSFDAGADVITRATFISTRGGLLNTGLDNITIAQASSGTVPAPATLALVVAALAGALASTARQASRR